MLFRLVPGRGEQRKLLNQRTKRAVLEFPARLADRRGDLLPRGQDVFGRFVLLVAQQLLEDRVERVSLHLISRYTDYMVSV